jgi:hypothetical protein
MIELLFQVYLSGVVFFLSVSLLRIESSHLDMQVSRSRETKALLRQKIKRCKRDVMMSLVWPYLLFRLLKSSFLAMKSSE